MAGYPLTAYLAGVSVGLAVAIPIGPMAVFCIQRTLACGALAGVVIGLAAATVQVTYGTLALLGYQPSVDPGGLGYPLLTTISAGALFWFAFRIATREIQGAGPGGGVRVEPSRAYWEALVFGFTNPLAAMLFFAAFPALTSSQDRGQAPALIVGVFMGVTGWYVALSAAATMLRQRLTLIVLQRANKAAAAILAGLATWSLLTLWLQRSQ